MDFAEGPDLAKLLDEAPMRPERIIRLVRAMLEGLYHAHEQGLIHRDFKPENVIVERDSHGAEMPRIVDFGIAILRDGGQSSDREGRLTTNGLVLGTPHYMAPEQAVADPIDHRIDLFALGIVIYEMLSGRLPFDGSGAEVARANLLLDPPAIAQGVKHLEVDPLLEAFARRLMAKKPKERPATAKAARELLDMIERDRTTAAAMLGMLPELGTRTAAQTQPLASQPRAAYGIPEPAQTQQLRTTPSPSAPVAPPFLPPPAAPDAATPLAPMPLAYSAPHAVEPEGAPRAILAQHTSVRMPLVWPGTPVTRGRRPWIIAGVAAGTVGAAIAVIVGTTGATPALPPPPGDRVVVMPVDPSAGLPRAPEAKPPVITPPGSPPVAPSAVVPAVPAPTPPASPTSVKPPIKRPPIRYQSTRITPALDVKANHVAQADARSFDDALDAPAVPVKVADPKAADPKAADPKAADPKARPPSIAGITGNALTKLWIQVGTQLGRTPRDKIPDLWAQYTLIKIQSLMAPQLQAEREDTAALLQRISQEATRLNH
jgi:hypothetical protein